jgi:NAD(P)-dependent dehydrogenase (short-subunit alcohol dehydrogenase family)
MTLGFARAGADRFTICSRSTSELDEVAAKIRTDNGDIKVSIVKCDVTSEEEYGRLDVLINNTGYLDASWQPITSGSAETGKGYAVLVSLVSISSRGISFRCY